MISPSATSTVKVDLFDLEQATFTRTDELEAHYSDRGEDLARGRKRHHLRRKSGRIVHPSLLEGWRGVVESAELRGGEPSGIEVEPSDLPPRAKLFKLRLRGHFRDDSPPRVSEGIAGGTGRPGGRALYQAIRPVSRQSAANSPAGRIHAARADPMADRNPLAAEIAGRFEPIRDETDPNCVIAIGGDGTMLHAIQTRWRKRVPFIGVNAGIWVSAQQARGRARRGRPPGGLPNRNDGHATMPMIYAETTAPDGTVKRELSFNDAWVDAHGAVAWLPSASMEERHPQAGVRRFLASTAAGSTAYAMSMGAQPFWRIPPAG